MMKGLYRIDESLDDLILDILSSKSAKSKPTVKNAAAPPAPPKDTERQLSKKELKKKELAELYAVLAELGLGTSNNSTQDESNGKF